MAAGRLRRYAVVRYAFAIVSAILALVVRWLLSDDLPPGFPFLTFFPAVILTAFVAGLGPGVVCATLSGLFAWYFFVPPLHSFVATFETGVALSLYVFIVTVDLAVIHVMLQSLRKLRVAQALTATLHDEQRTMFHELQHRVANNMAFIASVLQLERRRAPALGGGVTAFDAAIARIEVMSRIHRRLYEPDMAGRSLQADFEALGHDLVAISGKLDVTLVVDVAQVKIDLPRLIVLSQLVAELVMNALKHAFAPGQSGTISIALHSNDSNQLQVCVSDDGRGLAGAAPKSGNGLGTRIVDSLAAQLGGKVTVVDNGGVATCLVFPR